MRKKLGTLFIVSAPSGGGKTSLLNEVLETTPSLQLSISYTTRAMRPKEYEGINYHFVSKTQFEAMIAADEFFEYANVFGHYYGTSKSWVNEKLSESQDVILEIDWQGAQKVRKLVPEAVSIFILPPSLQVLEQRLNNRGQDSEDVIARRLSEAKEEISHCEEYDYIIINEEFARALQELRSIIITQRLEAEKQLH